MPKLNKEGKTFVRKLGRTKKTHLEGEEGVKEMKLRKKTTQTRTVVAVS